MDTFLLNSKDEKLRQLKAIFPEVFDEGKIDWEKLKATLGEEVNFSSERYVLNWAGKSEAFRVLQQKKNPLILIILKISSLKAKILKCLKYCKRATLVR